MLSTVSGLEIILFCGINKGFFPFTDWKSVSFWFPFGPVFHSTEKLSGSVQFQNGNFSPELKKPPLCEECFLSVVCIFWYPRQQKYYIKRTVADYTYKTLSTGWLFQYPAHLPLCCTPLRKYEKFYKDHRFTSLFLSHSFCTRKAGYLYNSNKHFGIHRINFSMYATPGDISSKTNTCSHF